MIYMYVFAGFFALIMFNNLFRSLKIIKLLKTNEKMFFALWNIVLGMGMLSFLIYIVTQKISYLLFFPTSIAFSGVMMLLFPKTHLDIQDTVATNIKADAVYKNTVGQIETVNPSLQNLKNDKPISAFSSPYFVRMIGLGLTIVGTLFVFYLARLVNINSQ